MKLSRRQFSQILIAGAAVVLSLVRAPLRAAESVPEVIRVASFGNASGKPYGLGNIGVVRAHELLEKEFAAEGIRIEWQFPRGSGPAINEALANGQLDFANYGGLPNIVGRGAGLKTRVLASYGTSPVYLVARPDSGISGPADLKGRKIAVSRGTINELSLFQILEQAGVDIADVQIFDLQTADQAAAITSGDVDAVVGGGSPQVLDLVEKNVARLVYSTQGRPAPGSSFGSFIVTDAFAEKYPDITARVVKVFLQASHFASQEENREALFDIWARTGAPRSTLVTYFEGDLLKDRNSPLLDDFYTANLRAGIDFALKNKLIRKTFDVDEWIDRRFFDAAVKELGYENVWTARNAEGAPAQ